MTHQKYLDSKEQEQREDNDSEYECDHEYTIRSKGSRVCVSCGMGTREITMFVPEEGYEDRVIVQREVRRTMDDLRVVIRYIF